MSNSPEPARAEGAQPGGPLVCPAVLDLASASWLRDEVLRVMSASPGLAVEIDAGAVTQIDTANVQILLAARRELERQGGTLTVRSPSAAVLRVATRLGLAAALDLPSFDAQAAAGGAPISPSDERK